MKKMVIMIAAMVLLTVHSGPVAAQNGGIFSYAWDRLSDGPGGQGAKETPLFQQLFGGLNPVGPGKVSTSMMDRLDSMMPGTTTTLPPISWGGTVAAPGSMISTMFHSLDDRNTSDNGFFFSPPTEPGVYIGSFRERTGVISSGSSTVITGFPKQQPLFDLQQYGSSDSEKVRSYYYKITEQATVP